MNNKRKIIAINIILVILCAFSNSAIAQTAFTAPTIVSQTGASTSYSSTVVSPETVQPSGGCAETGANWTHSFTGTNNRKLTGFTIVSTNYYVNNFGSLSTVMRRNNASGSLNPSSCGLPIPAIPWNDRQITFYEGTEDTVANSTTIVSSFPSLTTPGSSGYNAINDMNLVFSRGFLNSGADNIFNNRSGTGTGFNSNANNIERMDLFVSGGVTVTAANINKTGIVIVCRGPADDPFVLSAMKGLSGGANIGGGTNYVYDDVIKVNATWTSKTINGGGAIAIAAGARVTLVTGINTIVLRRTDTDGLLDDQLSSTSYPTASSFTPNQNIVAMFFTFGDLGLVAGDVFYGYSVAGFDVTAVNSNQYNSYLNSTYFPLTTTPADGGVDLTGFPGLFTPVDIDDDDDGLPDYLEANLPLAFGDHDTDGIPNWNDVNYPGFVDNNTDNVNDNFDPSADSDNDGTQNYRDNSFAGFIDINLDTVNDNFDWDLDGIPNHLDRDTDNDGVPDTAESFGVDTNGDGKIDNYSDTDVDGLSQNVDGSSTGATGSGIGLGAIDTDGDTIPNYMDHDSDNDGIPDVTEAFGTDTNNDGKQDSYSDTDFDGFSDNVDGDANNDETAENAIAALLRTGSDGGNDGRCDSWPYKNIDSDVRANPYDVDSDADGIIDLIEAGFTDADYNGIIDGVFNSKGWNTVVAALPSLSLPNTDGIGRSNPYDIDSDEDGIPDNVEGLSTTGYLLPANGDSDNDGLDNTYDNIVGFSGRGIPVNDQDSDATPDYLDSDTDNDGSIDRIEGNDLNLNGLPDDNVTLTGLDTDADGLDNRFDNNNTTVEGTSARMGNGGTLAGDPTPGSITTVQRTASAFTCTSERDWRCMPYVLNCELITFSGVLKNSEVKLDWSVLCQQEVEHFEVERSTDGTNFSTVGSVNGNNAGAGISSYMLMNNITGINVRVIYYRLRSFMDNGKISLSKSIFVRVDNVNIPSVTIVPNPVKDFLQVQISALNPVIVSIDIINSSGIIVKRTKEMIQAGNTSLSFNESAAFPNGAYYFRLNVEGTVIVKNFYILK